jgi:hypothetical protein
MYNKKIRVQQENLYKITYIVYVYFQPNSRNTHAEHQWGGTFRPAHAPIRDTLSSCSTYNYLLHTVGKYWQMLIAPVRTTLPCTDSYVENSARPKGLTICPLFFIV